MYLFEQSILHTINQRKNTMTTYTINYSGSVEIEAENEEQATEKAWTEYDISYEEIDTIKT